MGCYKVKHFFWKVHFLPFQKRYSFLCCSKNLLGYDFFYLNKVNFPDF